jgi:hypothetical protein
MTGHEFSQVEQLSSDREQLSASAESMGALLKRRQAALLTCAQKEAEDGATIESLRQRISELQQYLHEVSCSGRGKIFQMKMKIICLSERDERC